MRPARLLLLFALSACGGAQPAAVEVPAETPASADLQAAIEGAMEQYRQAYEVRSPEAMAAVYENSLDLSLVYQGRAHRGWTEVERFLSSRLEGATKARIVIKDLNVQALGDDAALASASLESSIGDDATTTTERGMVSMVWRRAPGGEWKILSEHFSYPTGGGR